MLPKFQIHLLFFFLFFISTFSFAQDDNILEQNPKYWKKHINQLNLNTATCYIEGDYEAAEYLNNIAYQEAKHCLNEQSLAYIVALYNYGMFLDHHGKHEEAIKVYQKVKDLEETLQVGNDILSFSYNAIGWAYQSLGDYHNTLNYMEKAIQLRQDSSLIDSVLVAFVSDKALCLEHLGALNQAKETNQTCLDMINTLENKASDYVQQVALYCYQNLASIALKEKENTTIIDNLLRASERIIKSYQVNQKLCYTYELWGNLKVEEGDYSTAQQYYNKALNLLQKELEGRKKDIRLGTLYAKKAIAYEKNGQYKRALKEHQKALKAISIEADLTIEGLENPKKKQFINKLYAIEILAAKAHTLVQMNELEAADISYQLAIALIPETRRSYKEVGSKYQLANATTGIYEAAIEVVLQLFEKTKQPIYQERAFSLSESNKTVILLEDMQRKVATNTVSNATLKSLLQEEERLRYKMNALERQIVMLQSDPQPSDIHQQKVNRLKSDLLDLRGIYDNELSAALKEYPQYWSLRYDLPPMSVTKVQQEILADDETALLEFFVGDKAIYLFFITKTSFKIETIEKTTQLEQLIQNLQLVVAQSPRNQSLTEIETYDLFVENSTALYEILLANCLEDEKELERLIIIPDGPLYNVSMGILLKEAPTCQTPNYSLDSLDYLLEDYALSYHYSVQMFSFKNNKATNNKFVGFAPEIQGLVYTEEEVETIKRLLNGKSFIGQRATLEALKKYAANTSILHIATHAELGGDNHQLSQFFLYQGTMNYYDLENIDFNTDLVVLSACETGIGQVIEGEGAMTLARSIIRAGSSSVLATAWQVEDKATKSLMIHFYKNLKKGWTKDKALQVAKMQYLQEGNKKHPFYWASFQQYGQSGAIDIEPNRLLSILGDLN